MARRLHQPGLDEDGDDQDDAEEGGNRAGRQLRHRRYHGGVAVAEIDRAGGGHAFAENLVDEPDENRAEAGAEDSPAAAENRRSPDDDRRNGDELQTEAGQRIGVLVLRDAHEPRGHRAKRGQHIGAHPHEAGVDAGVTRRLLVAADRIGRPADRRIRKGGGGDGGGNDEEDDLVVEAEGVDFAEMEEGRKFPRLDLERDVLASGDAENHASPDEQHRQRGDERRHFENGDQQAVDQSDREPHDEAPDDSRPYPHVEIGRSEDHPKDRSCEAEGRADRKVQLLVDDDEGHADRKHAVARGVAQD